MPEEEKLKPVTIELIHKDMAEDHAYFCGVYEKLFIRLAAIEDLVNGIYKVIEAADTHLDKTDSDKERIYG